jgi:hypothetical protein
MDRKRRAGVAMAVVLGLFVAIVWSRSSRAPEGSFAARGDWLAQQRNEGGSRQYLRASSISGRVFSRGQGEIADASVCLVCGDCDVIKAPKATRCVRSDATGLFRFENVPADEYRLSATAAGFLPAYYESGRPFALRGRPLENYDLELTAGGALLSGTVVDATGGPVAGALLRFHFGPEWLETRAAFEHRTESDEDGHFTAWVTASRVGVLAQAEGYASATSIVFTPSGNLRMVLTPAARISGTVVSRADGDPVEGVVVTATSEMGAEHRGTSTEDGEFKIDGLRPGTYGLKALATGWLGEASGTITLDLGQEKKGAVVVVGPAVRVRGKVMLGSGPCKTGALQLDPAPGEAAPRLHAFANASGRVEIEAVPPGRYIPSVVCRGYDSRVEPPLDITNKNLDDLLWRFDPGATVRVHTVTADGKSVADVHLTLGPPPSAVRANKQPFFDYKQESTNEKGIATFTGVKAGELSLHAPPQGEPTAVRVAANTTLDVTLVVVPAGTIEVVVRGRHGQPNDGVAVSAEPLDRSKGSTGDIGTSRGGGLHRIGPLLAGSYTVSVRDRSNPTLLVDDGKPVIVRGGEVSRIEATYGGDDGQISGRVVDSRGRPLADVWVGATHATPEPDPYRSSVLEFQELRSLTHADGTFTLQELARDAAFTVTASHSLGGSARAANVKPGNFVELRLASPAVIRGVVRTRDGKAPAYFRIAVTNEAEQQSLSSTFGPDAAGSFEIEHVAAGEIALYAQASAELAHRRLAVSPGQSLNDVVLELGPIELTQAAQGSAPAPAPQAPDEPLPGPEQADSRTP